MLREGLLLNQPVKIMLIAKKQVITRQSTESIQHRPPVHLFTLSFSNPWYNHLFDSYSTIRSLSFVRLTITLAIFLYFFFAFLDPYIAPAVEMEITVIRIVSILFFCGIIILTYRPWGVKNFQFMMNVVVLFAGSGIITMILISQSTVYYVALILAVIYAHSLLRLRFIYATFSTWIVLLAYLLCTYGLRDISFEVYLNNAFFLVSANIMGMFGSYWLEYYMKATFWKERILTEQTIELQKEYQRKSDELDAARKIQLGMLPNEFPGCSDYQFSFSMQPASEVGGDYYDYQYTGDKLTFGIGDATGHGMQASVIVTAIKLLFSEHSAKTDPVEFLKRASRSISLMGFRNLFIAFAIGKLDQHVLELAGAGMPPALVYRENSGNIEQIPLKGLPLGSKALYPYQKTRTTLEPGDCVLLMTDGFPELAGKDRVMIGYEKTIELFSELAHLSPIEMIAKLQEFVNLWLNGIPQNDDITFFAFKRVR